MKLYEILELNKHIGPTRILRMPYKTEYGDYAEEILYEGDITEIPYHVFLPLAGKNVAGIYAKPFDDPNNAFDDPDTILCIQIEG